MLKITTTTTNIIIQCFFTDFITATVIVLMLIIWLAMCCKTKEYSEKKKKKIIILNFEIQFNSILFYFISFSTLFLLQKYIHKEDEEFINKRQINKYNKQ